MSASIDNLINVNFTKGRNDLLNFGLKLGVRGSISLIFLSQRIYSF